MQQRVVFLCYHAFGHINACLKLAAIIKQHGDEVSFAGVGFFQAYVLQQGFPYYVLNAYPFGLGLETWKSTIEKKKYVYFSALDDRINDRLAEAREADLNGLLESLKPDIILLDAFQATDFILLYHQLKQRTIRLVVLHTTLPTTINNNHPPLNSDIFPHDLTAVKWAIAKTWLQQFFKRVKKKIKNVGYSDVFIIERRLKRNRIPQQYISKKQNLLNFAVEDVDEFILLPKEFDFPSGATNGLQKHIGFLSAGKRNDHANIAYDTKAAEIQALKNKNAKIVYCSFGTIELKNKKIILPFLEKLIQIVQSENFVLLISLKAQQEDIAKLQILERTYVFNTVPQLEVLCYADVFITHGGINSIKEAVYAAVPMLMIPVHADYDPKGNAARVVYHGLGLRSDAQRDSAKEIKEKIRDLLNNPLYKKNLQELKLRDESYTANNFLQKLNAVKFLD